MKDISESKKDSSSETSQSLPPTPPLEAAARRLERLLGGGLTEKDRMMHTYTNPGKVVRRWLGTASGASGDASYEDISSAAKVLLDPDGPCNGGRALLLVAATSGSDGASAMEVDAVASDEGKKDHGYLTIASSREVECWLISLSVRLMWKDGKLTEALDLAQKGIALVLEHLHVASTKLTVKSGVSSSSLFPCLARMYRYRSLVAGSIGDPALDAGLRRDMVKAHNQACLRRDVDSQATLLNLMLHDLLTNSQSKWDSK